MEDGKMEKWFWKICLVFTSVSVRQPEKVSLNKYINFHPKTNMIKITIFT